MTRFIHKTAWLTLAIILVVLPSVVQPFGVVGNSMQTTYHSGDVVLVDMTSLHMLAPRRADVLIIRNPHDTTLHEIKRVVGLPYETVRVATDTVRILHADGTSTIYPADTLLGGGTTARNGVQFDMYLGPNDYFVLGDNRLNSQDSRLFGAVQKTDFLGRVLLKIGHVSIK